LVLFQLRIQKMKIFYALTFSLFFTTLAVGQEYLSESSMWQYRFGEYTSEYSTINNGFSYLDGDTTVNGLTYWKNYHDVYSVTYHYSIIFHELLDSTYNATHELWRLMRQEGERIIYRYPGWEEDFYGFNYDVTIGDTILANGSCPYSYTITAIDSIFFNGGYRKFVSVTNNTYPTNVTHLIEGIHIFLGCPNGIGPIEGGYYSFFVCYSMDGDSYQFNMDYPCETSLPEPDTVAPILNCSAISPTTDYYYHNFCAGLPDYRNQVSISDNVDFSPDLIQIPAPGSLFEDSIVVTIIGSDVFNNTSECSFIQYKLDHISPEIECSNEIDTLISLGESGVTVQVPLPVVSDNCGIESTWNDYNFSSDASDWYQVGEHLINFTTVDHFGNEASCQTTLRIVEDTAPMFFLEGDEPVEAAQSYCEPFFQYGCPDDLIDTLIIRNAEGNVIMANLNTNCSDIIEFEPIFGITTCDLLINHSYETYVRTAGGFIQYYGLWCDWNNDGDFGDAGEWLGSTLNYAAYATFSFVVPEHVPIGRHRLRAICTFDDNLLHSDFCMSSYFGECEDYLINVVANPMPSFCGEVPDYVSFLPVWDIQDPNPLVTQNPPAGTVISDSLNVEVSAIDNAGNTTTIQIMVYADAIAPVINCPFLVDSTWLEGNSFSLSFGDPVVSDNCDSVMVTNNIFSGPSASGVYYSGETEIIYFAHDLSGNESSCSILIDLPYIIVPNCPGDVNGDLTVDMTDLNLLIGSFGCINDCAADLDNDLVVGSADLQIVIGNMSNTCD
jgi:hypothetical protein